MENPQDGLIIPAPVLIIQDDPEVQHKLGCPECGSLDFHNPLRSDCETCQEDLDHESCYEPPFLETKEEKISLKVKISYHKFHPNMEYWSKCISLNEAIASWSFGASRPGAHYWDETSAHIAQNPDTNEYLLLYM